MKVKEMLIIFFLSGVFWFPLAFFIFSKIDKNKVSYLEEGVRKEDHSNNKYDKKQVEFIKQFKTSFNDR